MLGLHFSFECILGMIQQEKHFERKKKRRRNYHVCTIDKAIDTYVEFGREQERFKRSKGEGGWHGPKIMPIVDVRG